MDTREKHYWDELPRERLTPEQEVEIASQIQKGLNAEKELGAQKSAASPDLKKEIEAGRQAKWQLCQANLRLVPHILSSYYRIYPDTDPRPGLSWGDLVGEGNLGLIRAAERFDPSKARFSGFALHEIRGAISTALDTYSYNVPIKAATEMRQFWRSRADLASSLRREPTKEEIAKDMDVPFHKVDNYELWEGLNNSLEEVMAAEAVSFAREENLAKSFQELLIDADSLTPEQKVEREDAKRAVNQALEHLTEREREILELRYGLKGNEGPLTLEQVGKKLNVTRERIRQIETRVIARLGHPTIGQNLPGYEPFEEKSKARMHRSLWETETEKAEQLRKKYGQPGPPRELDDKDES